MTKLIVINSGSIGAVKNAGCYRVSFIGFLDMCKDFGAEIYEVANNQRNNIAQIRSKALERAFRKSKINNPRGRIKIMAEFMNIKSINLEGRIYNPQARIFKKIPENKLTNAYNKLYKEILNL